MKENKRYTLGISTMNGGSEKFLRLMKSIDTHLDKSRFNLLVTCSDYCHSKNLNILIDASRTPYLIFVDDDVQYTEKHVDLFDKLDAFWDEHFMDAATISFGFTGKDEYLLADESSSHPYFNFCHTVYSKRCRVSFNESFEYTQANDIYFYRLLRYLGWNNYGAEFMTLNHFHTPKGDNKELNARILKNQELLIKIFSCPTDGLPEKHNGWGPLEKYLIEKCGKMPFMNREEIINE